MRYSPCEAEGAIATPAHGRRSVQSVIEIRLVGDGRWTMDVCCSMLRPNEASGPKNPGKRGIEGAYSNPPERSLRFISSELFTLHLDETARCALNILSRTERERSIV